MKKFLLLCCSLGFLLFAGVNASHALFPADITIRVTGDAGLELAADVTIPKTGGNEKAMFDIVVPWEGTVYAELLTVQFQKQSSDGYFKVQLIRHGEVVREGETSAAYGKVWLTMPLF
ncbi:hypothetical protein LJC31_04465 [Synergistaceae bacterium OttesenSCG-928-I11]|nr:hypothetical protein [Synergistaceae bacterium OttesenSCG-928-I11]